MHSIPPIIALALVLLLTACGVHKTVLPPVKKTVGINTAHPTPSHTPERSDDADKDGILFANDACPDSPEDLDGFEDEDGCPEPDNDQDGIEDTLDACPNKPETFNGRDDEDGCPDTIVYRLPVGPLEIKEKIFFPRWAKTLSPRSSPVLKAIAEVIIENPSIGPLHIHGHSAVLGRRQHQEALAQLRAKAVRDKLISLGVDPARLRLHAHGATRPLTLGTQREDHQLNSRVDFTLDPQRP